MREIEKTDRLLEYRAGEHYICKIRKPNNSMGLSTLQGHLGRNRGAMKSEVFGKSNLMIVAALRRGWSGYADQPTVSRR
jgi:hypothetical protein